jgi:hypothetical protein
VILHGYKRVTNKPKRDRTNENFLQVDEKKKWEKPSHKSKSVAALPCNRPFAATHMLFLPTRQRCARILVF